jgi:hypothetical protein
MAYYVFAGFPYDLDEGSAINYGPSLSYTRSLVYILLSKAGLTTVLRLKLYLESTILDTKRH